VYAVDLDGDGDIDVLSASAEDDKIAWYENDGAADPSFTSRTITTSADGARSVYAIDIDQDGDIDVLSASWNDNEINWYENDGAADPSFSTNTITNSGGLNPTSVFAIDLDRDGDVDVITSYYENDKIAWYENDGAGNPSFTAHNLTGTSDGYQVGASSVYAADMDNDGDMDVVSAANTLETPSKPPFILVRVQAPSPGLPSFSCQYTLLLV
jgi:hypothetical protein